MNPIPLLGYDLTEDGDDRSTARGIGNGLAMGVLMWLALAVLWAVL